VVAFNEQVQNIEKSKAPVADTFWSVHIKCCFHQ